jgi:hypothetical protein
MNERATIYLKLSSQFETKIQYFISIVAVIVFINIMNKVIDYIFLSSLLDTIKNIDNQYKTRQNNKQNLT